MNRLRCLHVVGWTILMGLLLPGCRAPQVPRPPLGSHRPELEDAEEVDYPPPPARIEQIDLAAHQDDGCVWVDGAWRWNGRRWVWEPGVWVRPPAGCYFAPGESFWQPSEGGPGVLYHRNPVWYPAATAGEKPRPCPPAQRCD